MRLILFAVAAAALAGPAGAEVVERSDAGFRIRNVVQVSAPPARVYQALGEIGRWWDGAHSYSGKAENLTLSLQPGGCLCEKVEGGGVQHGTVVLALPGQVLRLDAALGPLQDEAVTAVLSFTLKAKDGGTEVVETFNVSATRPETSKNFAAPVDQVVGAAVRRLERYVETGKPD
ncbi:MAG TPA: SRPBCC domain-containing protein [Phenylobacterium sp.]